jgi:hypothetical protein
MTDGESRIENLMKVSLKMRTDPQHPDQAASFEFIYGVGPDGITPFEKALFGKGVGDHVQFDGDFFSGNEALGHLSMPLCEQTGIASPVAMQVTVQNVVKALDREVVKAMAFGGSCGDCDCGCGGH